MKKNMFIKVHSIKYEYNLICSASTEVLFIKSSYSEIYGGDESRMRKLEIRKKGKKINRNEFTNKY